MTKQESATGMWSRVPITAAGRRKTGINDTYFNFDFTVITWNTNFLWFFFPFYTANEQSHTVLPSLLNLSRSLNTCLEHASRNQHPQLCVYSAHEDHVVAAMFLSPFHSVGKSNKALILSWSLFCGRLWTEAEIHFFPVFFLNFFLN